MIMQPDGEVDIPIRRPDGDVELGDAGRHFRFPPCKRCGGILKPNVVFFGDSIPKDRALRYCEVTRFVSQWCTCSCQQTSLDVHCEAYPVTRLLCIVAAFTCLALHDVVMGTCRTVQLP